MFTGIIEEMGTLSEFERADKGARLFVETTLGGIKVGDSVSVSGCCLTAIRITEKGFEAEASTETLERTTLGELGAGSPVNLERALAAGDRMGGHIVQGHVDGVGSIASIQPDGEARIYRFEVPVDLLAYFAEKGSVAVDGISLTVNGVDNGGFFVTLIPHTLAVTTLGQKQVGRRVNLETDVLAKYVVRALGFKQE